MTRPDGQENLSRRLNRREILKGMAGTAIGIAAVASGDEAEARGAPADALEGASTRIVARLKLQLKSAEHVETSRRASDGKILLVFACPLAENEAVHEMLMKTSEFARLFSIFVFEDIKPEVVDAIAIRFDRIPEPLLIRNSASSN